MKRSSKIKHLTPILLGMAGCFPPLLNHGNLPDRVIPAEEFSRTASTGDISEFSIYKRAAADVDGLSPLPPAQQPEARAQLMQDPSPVGEPTQKKVQPLDTKSQLEREGFKLKGTIIAPESPEVAAELNHARNAGQVSPPQRPRTAAGSSAPYFNAAMTANPSLWPDSEYGASLFRDFRAFEVMDVITITVNESSKGKKKAETETETKFSLLAAIENFFGVETKSWKANNEGLDPSNLINATTNTKFEGDGETERSSTLTATISAVILEVLPNGLMRIEGTKIITVNEEEQVMVISGLARQRDIDASNMIDSGRVANMRVDYYGRGLLAEQQAPGWGTRVFQAIWPF